MKYLLIGGGLASSRASAQIRNLDPDGSICIVSDETVPPYDRPPLSKEYLRGEKAPSALLFEDIPSLNEKQVELMLGHAVTGLDASRRVATVADGEEVSFEKALLATGGRPVRLTLPGSELPGVHYLRTLADADAIAAEAVAGRKAVIVGAGFIGLEVAATLRTRGLEVTVIETLPRIWARFGNEDLSAYVQGYCTDRGVRFLLGTAVSEFLGENRVVSVRTADGQGVACDLVCIGVGIVPNVELATSAGLAVDNGVLVDEQLRTSNPDIYAAGDVINYFDPIFNKRRRVEHWGHAEYTGMVAGRNMAGASDAYGFLSYVWSDIFDLHLEFAGDETEHDAVLIRGRPADGSFIIMYSREGRLTAFFAVNASPREFSAIRRHIQARRDIAGHESDLQDTAFDLRSLV